MKIAVLIVLAVASVGVAVTLWLNPTAPRWIAPAPSRIALREGHPAAGRLEKSDEEWARELTPDQFRVTRRAGTERACSSPYHNTKEDGVYHCVCCGQALFDSGSKFDSGTGWPSYWQPIDEEHVTVRVDDGPFGQRFEVLCSRCDAHLGHVFEDGPPPTGLRYCMNALALKFVPRQVKKDQKETK